MALKIVLSRPLPKSSLGNALFQFESCGKIVIDFNGTSFFQLHVSVEYRATIPQKIIR